MVLLEYLSAFLKQNYWTFNDLNNFNSFIHEFMLKSSCLWMFPTTPNSNYTNLLSVVCCCLELYVGIRTFLLNFPL